MGFLGVGLCWNMFKGRGLGLKRVVFYKVYEIWYVLTWETDQLYNLTGNPAECDHNKIPLPKIKCYAIVYVNFGWFPSWLYKRGFLVVWIVYCFVRVRFVKSFQIEVFGGQLLNHFQ